MIDATARQTSGLAAALETFDLSAYLNWIRHIGTTRPVVPATHQRPDEPRWLALQHDIDLSLDWAVTVAEAEAEAGIRACYYVQVGCPFYDVASPRGREQVTHIYMLGHRIGLHYDWRRYEAAGEDLQLGLTFDLDLLRQIVADVKVVAAHMPMRNGSPVHGLKTPQIEGEVYVSDSARGFRDDTMAILADPPDKLRFNMHPCWWVGEGQPLWPTQGRASIVRLAALKARERIIAELEDWQDISSHPNAVAQDRRNG